MQAGADLDAASIDASRRGDRTAFAEIIERYHRAVYAVAFSTVRDRALSDDITQDTFLTAWRHLDDLRDSNRLPAWLCGIARNLGRDARKRLRRETLGEPPEPIDTATPFDALSEAESERLVEAALGQIPDVYREPLVLFYYEDRSVEDVARSLGISAATTNKRLSRGRQFLAERVATIVERGLTRHGPSPGLAAAVLATIGIAASASHVDASPVAKGSTMHKLAIAAVVTATLGGAGLIFATATRGGDAHAAAAPAHGSNSPSLCDLASSLAKPAKHEGQAQTAGAHHPLSLASTPSLFSVPAAAGAIDSAATDCASVGHHLAELEGDTTHGPDHRPDEATCAQCAATYTTQCENQGWTAERRACTVNAGDLINAHLCAGGDIPTTGGAATDIPPELSCAVLGQHVATTMQAAGFHPDATDLPQQIESACEVGGWALDMRRCFVAASSVDMLQACVTPAASH